MVLKNSFFPLKSANFNEKYLVSNYINNNKIKDLLYQKQKLIKEKRLSRNKSDLPKFQTITKSSMNKLVTKIELNFIPHKNQKPFKYEDKKNNTMIQIINPYISQNKIKYNTKRNYSAYYLKDDLLLKKKYLSEILLKQNKKTRNKSQNISDIEKKISELEKNLNISHINSKNSSFFISSASRRMPKIIIKKKKEENKNKIPDYLKEEFKIKGTNITSPFCKKWRDKRLNEKFNEFLDKGGPLKDNKKIIFDNKLNIIYAENENMYQKKLKILNNKLSAQGKKKKYKFFSPSEIEFKDIEKRVSFMKNVFYFVEQKKFDFIKKKIKKKQKKIVKSEHINKTCREFQKINIFEMNFK